MGDCNRSSINMDSCRGFHSFFLLVFYVGRKAHLQAKFDTGRTWCSSLFHYKGSY